MLAKTVVLRSVRRLLTLLDLHLLEVIVLCLQLLIGHGAVNLMLGRCLDHSRAHSSRQATSLSRLVPSRLRMLLHEVAARLRGGLICHPCWRLLLLLYLRKFLEHCLELDLHFIILQVLIFHNLR